MEAAGIRIGEVTGDLTGDLLGILPQCVLLLCMLYLCFRGYKLYRVALFILGFLAGYVLSGSLLSLLGDKVPADKSHLIMLIAGVVLGILSSTIVNLGVFFAVFHFVRYVLGGPIATVVIGFLEKKVTIPAFLLPTLTGIIGFAAALLLARLARRFLAPVIRVLTAVTGGFYAVDAALLILAALLPEMVLPARGSLLVTGAKLILAAAGIFVQQTGGGRKK